MSGTKIGTAQNITWSVLWLDTASQTVRLCAGSLDDGMMNGNSANPAVSTTPATRDAGQDEREHGAREAPTRSSARIVAPNAASGATTVHGCFE